MLRRASLDDLEQISCQLAPTTEHRIIRIQNEEVSVYTITLISLICNFLFQIFQHYKQLVLKRDTNIKNSTITEAEDE